MEKKEKDLKKIGIIALIVFLVLLVIVLLCIILFNKNCDLNISSGMRNFERIITYKYLEDDYFDVDALYILNYSNSDDEVKKYQYETQYVLNDYFESNPSETSVSEEVVRNLLKNKFGEYEPNLF